MVVSLFTSRVVLNTLGVEDYGIYNVVGGIVAMFGFLNASMSSSTQRYIAYALGKNDYGNLRKIFSTCFLTHLLIAFVVLVLIETVGIWLLYNKMVIPTDRMNAAFWVFQFSSISAVVAIIGVPFNSDIIAHEKMSAFAYISILEVVLKLVIVYMLSIGNIDKLILYAALILVVQISIVFFYQIYCLKHFEESRIKFIWDGSLFKEIFGFAGWNMWGCLAHILYTQGLNILLNMFFGPAVNAARGVATQVQGCRSAVFFKLPDGFKPTDHQDVCCKRYEVYAYANISKFKVYFFFTICLIASCNNGNRTNTHAMAEDCS